MERSFGKRMIRRKREWTWKQGGCQIRRAQFYQRRYEDIQSKSRFPFRIPTIRKHLKENSEVL